MKNDETETMNFEADVSRLLDIVAHALYSNRDVFLRELISNAADACDRMRYQAIKQPELIKDDADFSVRVYKDTDARTLTVIDNGIGMDRDDLVNNLGTIARSGTAALMEQVQAAGNEKDKLSLIGQFGVGFYASFMVSDTVEVITQKAGDKQAWHWQSDGKTGFSVREASDEEAALLSAGRGSAIIMNINDDSSEFLLDEKLKIVIQTYSDHINFPIFLGRKGEKNDLLDPNEQDTEHPINKASALWARSKQDVTEDEYKEFYHHIGHGQDVPLLTSHWRAEGKIEYSALLFTPTLRPWDLYDPTRRHSVRLYVRRVFIADDCENLMYPWLRFIRGVIDSEDLPLNISREMLQHNPVIDKIRNSVAKRILGDLNKFAANDEVAFAAFWGQFGAVLKEGLYDAIEHRDSLLKVVRFYSSAKDNELTSLADYVARMSDDQEEIYYISGENMETLKNSPQLEGFKARGIEVLFFTDTIDDFWLQNVLDYDGKKFISVTKGSIDLDRFDKDKGDKKQEDKEESESKEATELIAALAGILKDEISAVRASNRLTESPVCLIANDMDADLRMERVLKIHQNYEPQSKRVLEINPGHPLIKAMEDLTGSDKNKAKLEDAAYLLLDQARIIQGEPVPDPAKFAQRMAEFMTRGL